MLSVGKHLQYLLEDNPMQILRFAQDDSPEDLFRSLFSQYGEVNSPLHHSHRSQSLP
jgi:hypothetical protein